MLVAKKIKKKEGKNIISVLNKKNDKELVTFGQNVQNFANNLQ